MTARTTTSRLGHVARALTLALTLAACRGGTDAPTGSTDPPPRDDGTTLALTPARVTLRAGQYQRVTLRTPDGAAPAGPITWSVGDPRVVYVYGDTMVRGIVPGTTTVTAAVGGRRGSIEVTVPADLAVGEFVSPLGSLEARTVSVFDHDLPREFNEAFSNGYTVGYWGERVAFGIDSHIGYDWVVPTGTPIYAVGAGRVHFAGAETPWRCPFFPDALVAATIVVVYHGTSRGASPAELISSTYAHLSRVDVVEGQQVVAGQRIGLSGNTGCSLGPHLHFSTSRLRGIERLLRTNDPFGWTGPGTDPWAADTGGVASIALWNPARAPALYGERRFAQPSATARAYIYLVRDWAAPASADLARETVAMVATSNQRIDIAGWVLRNGRGERYLFPPGSTLDASPGTSVRSTAGRDVPAEHFWGRTTSAWNNEGDCAELLDAKGVRVVAVEWGVGSCGATRSGVAAVRAPPDDGLRDAQGPVSPPW